MQNTLPILSDYDKVGRCMCDVTRLADVCFQLMYVLDVLVSCYSTSCDVFPAAVVKLMHNEGVQNIQVVDRIPLQHRHLAKSARVKPVLVGSVYIR